MRFVSDIEIHEGSYAIEWEYAYGGRWWQSFETEQDLNDALTENEKELDENKEEVDQYRLEERLHLIQMSIEYEDYGLTDFEKLEIEWYLKNKDKELKWSDYEEFYKEANKSLRSVQ